MVRASCLFVLLLANLWSFSASAEKSSDILVWSDEFDGTGGFDREKWDAHVGGGGFGNNELQHYTDRPDNARVENGELVIRAVQEKFGGDEFTSAKLMSRGPGWKYARIEVRARVPYAAAGTWPAIWMLAREGKYGNRGWPDNGEMDILEYVGRDPNTALSCFYTKNFNWMNNNGKTSFVPLKSPADFHVYSLEWSEAEAKVAIDGLVVNHFVNPKTEWGDWPFDQNYYLILNMALGGFGGAVPEGFTPQEFRIDYVRVYQRP